MTTEESGSSVPGWLAPLVAVLGGAVIGGLALFALVFPFAERGVAVAFVVWLGATVHLLRRPTIHAVVQHGAYGLAVVLVALPAGLLLGTTADPATRLTALVLYEVVAGAFALGAVTVGYVVGGAAPEQTATEA